MKASDSLGSRDWSRVVPSRGSSPPGTHPPDWEGTGRPKNKLREEGLPLSRSKDLPFHVPWG